ncbi:MAG: exo-alpha-sialidase [Verrucomicrobia bacterium]|nr:exo-alpha-sialidase [Verrucomicrobiota bacterium]
MLSQFLLSLLLAASVAAAADFPIAKVITSPGPDYDETKRRWQGIPGIERAANGRLWSTWYTGDIGEGAIGNYAMSATCADVGQRWSKPMAIQGPEGTRIGDPLPWIDPKGRLWIFYAQYSEKTEAAPSTRATFAIRTDDPGNATPKWSDPFVVVTDGILFGKPIIRNDGAWVAPFFVNGKPDWSEAMAGKETGTVISTDEGASWKWLGGTHVPKDLLNFSEATLAQRKDGSLWMVIRTLVGLVESTSADGGLTWSAVKPIPGFEKGPSTRACMRRLASGAFMLVYHDAPPNKTGGFGRAQITAWLSDDEGRTWPHKLLLDEHTRVSYPDATQAPDGRIFITYDWGRYAQGEKSIMLSVIREEDIRAGKIVSKDAKLKIITNQCYAYGNHPDLRDEEKVAASMPAKEKFHLYLLIGQSNMAGRGVMDDAQTVSKLRLLKFSQRNAWAPGVDPLHTDKPAAAGVGLGTSFARAMADADKEITVGLIPCAVGGTPLQRWQKGGDLYEQALVRVRLAMKDGTLKGILWHQGEGDSGKEETARSYGARLSQMITDLRADLGAGDVPFVAGRLGEFLSPTTREGKPSFWPVVNEQLTAIPQTVPNTAIVDSAGLKDKGDGVHFDTPSLREFGRRYAKAMQQLQK